MYSRRRYPRPSPPAKTLARREGGPLNWPPRRRRRGERAPVKLGVGRKWKWPLLAALPLGLRSRREREKSYNLGLLAALLKQLFALFLKSGDNLFVVTDYA